MKYKYTFGTTGASDLKKEKWRDELNWQTGARSGGPYVIY